MYMYVLNGAYRSKTTINICEDPFLFQAHVQGTVVASVASACLSGSVGGSGFESHQGHWWYH